MNDSIGKYAIHQRRRALALVVAIVMIGLVSQTTSAGDRFGSGGKRISFGFFGGYSNVTGRIDGIGTIGFPVKLGADSLYQNLRSFGFEYAEHTGKVTLASGLYYTSVEATDALKRSLGLSEDSALSVGYLDLPITYRVNLRNVESDDWNLSVGVSLIGMFDFVNSSQDIFLSSGSSGEGESSGGFSNKHIDFGVGFGAELAVRQRVSGKWYIAGRAGARTPISGVTRAPSGYLQFGALWLQL